jgi:(2Fe-2S) ferredoxin
MPRKSPGHDSRLITYRTLPGSSTWYQRVNVGECTAWVQTNLEFDLEVRHPDQTTEPRPFIVDTFCQHRGSVEPTLYLSPSGKWIRRVSSAEMSGLKPGPPLFIEITQPLATKWLWANGYPVPGCAAPVEANARIRDRRAPSPEQEYAHRLWHEGHRSQTEAAQEIERLFQLPFAQSQVSRAIKRVDDWLQSLKTHSPAGRARRPLAVGPSREEPIMPRTGTRLTRQEVDDRDD